MIINIIMEEDDEKNEETVEVAHFICDELTTITMGRIPIILSKFIEKNIDKAPDL